MNRSRHLFITTVDSTSQHFTSVETNPNEPKKMILIFTLLVLSLGKVTCTDCSPEDADTKEKVHNIEEALTSMIFMNTRLQNAVRQLEKDVRRFKRSEYIYSI